MESLSVPRATLVDMRDDLAAQPGAETMDKPRRRRGRGETAEALNTLTEEIIGAAITVHRELGMNGLHEAQLLTYLKLTGCCVGLLINFHTQVLRDGIRRRVVDFPDRLREVSASSASQR